MTRFFFFKDGNYLTCILKLFMPLEQLFSSTYFMTMKESRATLACLYRTSGRVYMLQLISVDSRPFYTPRTQPTVVRFT